LKLVSISCFKFKFSMSVNYSEIHRQNFWNSQKREDRCARDGKLENYLQLSICRIANNIQPLGSIVCEGPGF
jgi:hypothetical protein